MRCLFDVYQKIIVLISPRINLAGMCSDGIPSWTISKEHVWRSRRGEIEIAVLAEQSWWQEEVHLGDEMEKKMVIIEAASRYERVSSCFNVNG